MIAVPRNCHWRFCKYCTVIHYFSFCTFVFVIVNICHVRFYVRQLYRQVLLRAHISYGNSVCPSVCPSVTTRYGFKARWDRDSGSSPYDSLESLVSYEVIWCHWVKRFPSNEGIKEGYPLENVRFLLLSTDLAREWLQIDTDLLLIITSTADELSGGTNIDDLERHWTPKIWVLSDFLLF